MQFPEVMETIEDDVNKEKEWKIMQPIIEEAIQQCDDFRSKEGAVLTSSLEESV